MTDFNDKMHQIRFRLGLRPRTRQGERLGRGRGGKAGGEGREGEVDGRERDGPQVTVEPGPPQSLATPLNLVDGKHVGHRRNH